MRPTRSMDELVDRCVAARAAYLAHPKACPDAMSSPPNTTDKKALALWQQWIVTRNDLCEGAIHALEPKLLAMTRGNRQKLGDCRQEAAEVILRKAQDYDPGRGAGFLTFIDPHIGAKFYRSPAVRPLVYTGACGRLRAQGSFAQASYLAAKGHYRDAEGLEATDEVSGKWVSEMVESGAIDDGEADLLYCKEVLELTYREMAELYEYSTSRLQQMVAEIKERIREKIDT